MKSEELLFYSLIIFLNWLIDTCIKSVQVSSRTFGSNSNVSRTVVTKKRSKKAKILVLRDSSWTHLQDEDRLFVDRYMQAMMHNSLPTVTDPNQARQNIQPDLDPICLTLRWYSWKIFFKKLILKNSADDKKSMKNFPGGNDLMHWFELFYVCAANWSAV